MTISVIIPVYNVEQFIHQCLDSVLGQTCRDIEVICIDDGSTDDSCKIIERYVARDARVKLIRQQNQGAGKARNAGLKIAQGEFIAFMDPDDLYPSKDTLQHMYDAAVKNKVDISGGSLCQLVGDKVESDPLKFEEGYTFKQDGLVSYGDYQFDYGYWRFLYRRSFLQKNGLEFPDYRRQQDPPFMVRAFCLAERFYALKEPTYVYRVSHKTIEWNERKAHDLFCGVYDVLNYAIEFGMKDLYERVVRRLNTWTYRTACAVMLRHASVREQVLKVLQLVRNAEWIKSLEDFAFDDIFTAVEASREAGVVVSVIVPVYNVEKYLARCLDSILAQTFPWMEILCINDGSTDGSPAILKEYARKDRRVKILDKPNGGLSSARNWGMDRAHGDYMMFVDSDDWIDPRTLELSMARMSGAVDVVCWGATLEDDGVGVDNPNMIVGKRYHSIRITGQKAISDDVIAKTTYTAWNKLYKSKIFKQYGIRFCEGRLFEDNDVVIMYFLHCRDGFFLEEYLYHYVQRPGSIMEKMRSPSFNRSADNLYIFDNLYRHCDRCGMVWDHRALLESRFKYHLGAAYRFAKPEQKEEIRSLAYRLAENYDEVSLGYDRMKKLKQRTAQGVIELNDIIVSLTSFPARIGFVHQVIESIFSQSLKPRKTILWLAREQFPDGESSLPETLLRLRGDDFEIGWCEDLRSYKKLIPTLIKYSDSIIITVDDDVIYDKNMVQALVQSYVDHPEDIHCHRVSKFLINADTHYRVLGGGLHYYPDSAFLNKLVGVGGVLYPAGCFHDDITKKELFTKLAPTNDDQWFWAMAALVGHKVRMVGGPGTGFKYIEGSQEISLCSINDHGENLFWKDFARLIKAYPKFDQVLRRDWDVLSDHHNDNVSVYREQIERWYLRARGEVLDLDHPKTYNEKIQWLKVFDSTPMKTMLADKYLVRDWVADKIGSGYLIPLLGAYDRFDDIDFRKLPNRFVMKCNHGCAYNIIVKDKDSLDLAETRQKIEKWMADDFSTRASREFHYRDIKHKIIIEQYIENKKSDGDLYDYKFWCFAGKVAYIQFLSERNLGGLKMAFYDRKWRKQSFVYNVPLDTKDIERPDNLDEMISLAEKLSTGFPHVRVDFYRLDDGTIYFGEMTFTSASGGCTWNIQKMNNYFGELIALPKLAYNIDTGDYFPPKDVGLPVSELKSIYQDLIRERKSKRQVAAPVVGRIDASFDWRVDCLYSTADVTGVSLSTRSDGVSVVSPAWIKNNCRDGQCVTCNRTKGVVSFKSRGDGEIAIVLRGQDIRMRVDDKSRIPFYVDYTSIRVRGKEMLKRRTEVWYDVPYKFTIDVKAGETFEIAVVTEPHVYERAVLKDMLLKAKLPVEVNAGNVDAILDSPEIRPHVFDPLRNAREVMARLVSWRIDCRYARKDVAELAVNKYCVCTAVESPAWIKSADMDGQCITGSELKGAVLFRPQGSGEVLLNLMGPVVLDKTGKSRLPVYVTYTSVKVGGRELLPGKVFVRHGKPYKLLVNVKAGEQIELVVTTEPYVYTRAALKDLLLRAKWPFSVDDKSVDAILDDPAMRVFMPDAREAKIAELQKQLTAAQEKMEGERKRGVAKEKAAARKQKEVEELHRSQAYRTGMIVTWPARKAWGGVKCLRENGVGYTVKHLAGKIARAVGKKKGREKRSRPR